MKRNHAVQDKEYWENYYKARKDPFDPSLFARHVVENYVEPGESLIELGCGNGRDAIYFVEHGLQVTAVDQCEIEIGFLSEKYPHQDLQFMSGDFTALNDGKKYRNIYSRFTMHSVTAEGQRAVFEWLENVLEDGGCCLLEFRGKHNELCGRGTAVDGEPDAYVYEDHYRRFLDIDQISETLRGIGLTILESVEEKGFSPFGDEDETFARVIARR